MTFSPDIAAVVLTGGRVAHLMRCLESLAAGTMPPREVVVVDNDSSGETAKAFVGQTFPFPIRRVSGPPGGYAESRNLGVASAAASCIAFLDDDCLADKYWIERLAAALETHDAIGGPVLPARDHLTPPDFSPEINWLVGLSTPMLWTELGGKIELPSTSNMALRRAVWESVPFQEIGGRMIGVTASSNYLVGREDAQWWRRVRDTGVRTAIAHRAIVWHDFDRSRYAAVKTTRRAEADGRAHWRRECPREELRQAASDVVHYPVRVFEDWFRPDEKYVRARRRHRAWLRRQMALLNAAVDDPNCEFTPPERTGLLLREAFNVAREKAKPALRRAASISHHQFKRLMPLPDPDNPPRAMTVVCYDFLGDAVLAMPMLEQLRAAFPHTRLTLLTGEVAAPLFAQSRVVNDVKILPSGLGARHPAHVRRVYDAMRATEPEAIVVTYFHGASPLGLFASTSAPVVCWDRDHGMRQQLWPELASAVVPKSMRKAEVAALLDLLGPLGIPTRLVRPQFKPPRSAAARAEKILADLDLLPGRFTVVHMDADEGTRKDWPRERFGELARHLFERHGLRVLFVGTRHGRRHFEALDLPQEIAFSLHGMLDAAELGALQQHARLCIGVDSGPQHLAQAVGAPTLVLFESVQEPRWRPMPRLKSDGDRPLPFRTVQAANLPGDWLFAELDRFPVNEQLLRLTTEDVIVGVDDLLRESAELFG